MDTHLNIASSSSVGSNIIIDYLRSLGSVIKYLLSSRFTATGFPINILSAHVRLRDDTAAI